MVDTLEEHLSYLQIAGRADLYRAAISDSVAAGDVVADLGCGLGVLGLYCLEAGARHVYGIDHSDAIELARETMARAGLSDRYTCIANSTFRTRLPEPADVLICDHVGYFGMDYGILAMLRDASHRMLTPGGVIVPRAIAPVVAGVSSDACRDLAEEWSAGAIPEVYRWLDCHQRNSKHARFFEPGELCSAPLAFPDIVTGPDIPEFFVMEGKLTATRACRFDGLAGWFDCTLSDGVSMTNAPGVENAIERNQVFLPCADPFDVAPGDSIGVTLKFRIDGDMIAWTVTAPDGDAQTMSTWHSRILTPSDLAANTGKPLGRTSIGEARAKLLELVDGTRTADDIAHSLLAAYPDLFPSEDELRRFVARELASSAR